MGWTSDQLNAINARDGSLVVSAAAGSGKTTVLVERVLQRLTDPEKGCNADELLIVTFTRAATAEMRSRLADKITEALTEHPDDENLQRQQMLIPSAPIYTIDAFCSMLVRENFESLGIAPDFRMLDEGELKLLQQEAVETVMGQLYEENDPNFHTLVEQLFLGRDDSTLEDTILRLYNYSRAYPSPEKWLQESISHYDSSIPLQDSPAYDIMVENGLEIIQYARALFEKALDSVSLVDGVEESKHQSNLELDISYADELEACLLQDQMESALNLMERHKFPTWDSKTKGGKAIKEEPGVLEAKVFRDSGKDLLTKDLSKVICFSEADYLEDCEALQPIAGKLVEAALRFGKELQRRKEEQNTLDFSDIELLALKLLVKDPAAKPFERTDLAVELGQQYREILIDEYQDTNELQDTIFSAISKEEQNLFVVGDVKQSIYRFRQAMPEVFLHRKERYDLYDPEHPSYPATILLGQNFRSRKGITDMVNFTFRNLMSPSVGDIRYDEREELVFGATGFEEISEPECELCILAQSEEVKKQEQEALYLANYIQAEIQKSAGTGHPVSFRDFAILLRTTKNIAGIYERILLENGIPVYSDAGGSLLNTSDIQVMTSFLKVIDNPLQDIPLVSVLMSPVFGFTEDDMAALRVGQRHGGIYQTVRKGEENGNQKCIAFLTALRRYRQLAVSLPASELLRQIYEDTAYLSIAGALPNGTQRVANLHQLLRLADDYDSRSSYGVSGFIRYLARMEENQLDQQTASAIAPNADVVRITSIHKSKGLQYRICILADLSHRFNKSELTDHVILHPVLGIGIKGRDLTTGNTYPTVQHSAVMQEVNRSTLSELLRVLYVAMTRAKEKLILVGTLSKPEESIAKLALQATTEGPIPPYVVKSKNNFMDWLLLVALRHPSALALRNMTELSIPVFAETFPLKLNLVEQEQLAKEEAESIPMPDILEPLKDELDQRLSYEYPYAPLATTVTKRAASSVKDDLFEERYFANSRPEFLSKQGLTPAERGTCLHKFMQYADFYGAKDDPEAELERLVEKQFLSRAEADVVPPEKISRFFQSTLAERIFNSTALYREKKFAVLVPAGTFDDTLSPELAAEKVLIQGIVDCAFEEDGALVVVDYKTDRVSAPETLVSLYRDQILTYCEALSRCIGLPVKEAILYSFSLGAEVPVPLEESM